jgi:hypothetical protein
MFPTYVDLAAVWLLQSADQPQRGGFSAAAGPQQRKELPFLYCQTQIVHGNHVTKPLGNVYQFNAWDIIHETLRFSR